MAFSKVQTFLSSAVKVKQKKNYNRRRKIPDPLDHTSRSLSALAQCVFTFSRAQSALATAGVLALPGSARTRRFVIAPQKSERARAARAIYRMHGRRKSLRFLSACSRRESQNPGYKSHRVPYLCIIAFFLHAEPSRACAPVLRIPRVGIQRGSWISSWSLHCGWSTRRLSRVRRWRSVGRSCRSGCRAGRSVARTRLFVPSVDSRMKTRFFY